MNKAEKFWDNIAETYDKKEERYKRIHIETIENAKRYLKADDVILDYGCATGSKTLTLAGSVKNILGIDISSKMIEGAKQKAAERSVGNVDFEHTTIFDENLIKESFDVVLAFNILHTLRENRQAVERIRELLKPGGLFISITPCLNEKMALFTSIQFLIYFILIRIGLLPDILIRFKVLDLENLVKSGNFQIVETVNLYHDGMNYFIVAKKKE